MGFGGKLVENRLARDQGEYNNAFTVNAGSYYEKMGSAMLMAESVDNFISSSRTDFVDPRYRAVSLADLFPEGYRRWLASNLTGDDVLKGPRVAADTSGNPLVGSALYPELPIGWTSWWGQTPRVCFPGEGTTFCSAYAGLSQEALVPHEPTNSIPLDPAVGWEQQKFLIAWTMLYLPENEKRHWLDMMQVWELGRDADPSFGARIEFHDPMGRIYVARTFGKETIFGQSVQRGIAARVLEYANELLQKAYVTEDGPDLDGDGEPDWYRAATDLTSGLPLVRWDSSIAILIDGKLQRDGVPGCNAVESEGCACDVNRACVELERYISVPAYLRESLDAYQLGDPNQRGL